MPFVFLQERTEELSKLTPEESMTQNNHLTDTKNLNVEQIINGLAVPQRRKPNLVINIYPARDNATFLTKDRIAPGNTQ